MNFSDRRKRLIASLENGVALFLGNDESPRAYAHDLYPFRQDSSFRYFFGKQVPGSAAIIDLESGETTLFGPQATLDEIVWTGPQPSLAERADEVGISRTASPRELVDYIAKARVSGRKIHLLPPYRDSQRRKLASWLDLPIGRVDAEASEELIRAVVKLRSYKSAEEIEALEEAVTITSMMHRAAMNFTEPGVDEAGVAAELMFVANAYGDGFSFSAIVSMDGQVLHSARTARELKEGRLLLVDAGAESRRGYCGDMTRTYPVGRRFSTKQAEVYQVVLDAQEAAIEMLHPGVAYRDVHLRAAEVIAQGLKEIGLMRGDPAEAVAAGAHALFFPHGLGHMMGLDTHDMEGLGEDYVGYNERVKRSDQFGLAYLRLGRALEPDFVLTVEPGIYFIPELIDQWRAEGRHKDFIRYDRLEAYRDFGGIRIEDDFVITRDGAELLGTPLPKKIVEIEAIRNF